MSRPSISIITLSVFAGLFITSCGPPSRVQTETPPPPPLSPEATVSEQTSNISLPLPTSTEDNSNSSEALRVSEGVGLKPSLGLKTDKLFSFPVFDEKKRFSRLEAAVQTLRDEMDEVLPTVKTQLALQGDLKGLITRLNDMVSEVNAPSPIQINNPQQSAEGPKLLKMRAGYHTDKIRIVMETDTAPDFLASFDEVENILYVTSPGQYPPSLVNFDFNVRPLGLAVFQQQQGGYKISIPTKNLKNILENFQDGAYV